MAVMANPIAVITMLLRHHNMNSTRDTMHLFNGYNVTRNPSGRLEFWKTGEDWVITHFFANDINTAEHIRIGEWVCSVKRIMPGLFKVTYHYPMSPTPLDDFDF